MGIPILGRCAFKCDTHWTISSCWQGLKPQAVSQLIGWSNGTEDALPGWLISVCQHAWPLWGTQEPQGSPSSQPFGYPSLSLSAQAKHKFHLWLLWA